MTPDILDRLTDAQKLVVDEMRRDYGVPFDELAADTGLSRTEVRRAVRALAADGLADFGPLYSEDDGTLRGKGYWLSRSGLDVQSALREGTRP